MRRGSDFSETFRHGARGASRRLVVHVRPAGTDDDRDPEDTLVGLVVGRGVGDAVRRNTVKRRVRHLMAERVHQLPARSRVVVRALLPAAGASSAELGADLDGALSRAVRKAAPGRSPG